MISRVQYSAVPDALLRPLKDFYLQVVPPVVSDHHHHGVSAPSPGMAGPSTSAARGDSFDAMDTAVIVPVTFTELCPGPTAPPPRVSTQPPPAPSGDAIPVSGVPGLALRPLALPATTAVAAAGIEATPPRFDVWPTMPSLLTPAAAFVPAAKRQHAAAAASSSPSRERGAAAVGGSMSLSTVAASPNVGGGAPFASPAPTPPASSSGGVPFWLVERSAGGAVGTRRKTQETDQRAWVRRLCRHLLAVVSSGPRIAAPSKGSPSVAAANPAALLHLLNALQAGHIWGSTAPAFSLSTPRLLLPSYSASNVYAAAQHELLLPGEDGHRRGDAVSAYTDTPTSVGVFGAAAVICAYECTACGSVYEDLHHARAVLRLQCPQCFLWSHSGPSVAPRRPVILELDAATGVESSDVPQHVVAVELPNGLWRFESADGSWMSDDPARRSNSTGDGGATDGGAAATHEALIELWNRKIDADEAAAYYNTALRKGRTAGATGENPSFESSMISSTDGAAAIGTPPAVSVPHAGTAAAFASDSNGLDDAFAAAREIKRRVDARQTAVVTAVAALEARMTSKRNALHAVTSSQWRFDGDTVADRQKVDGSDAAVGSALSPRGVLRRAPLQPMRCVIGASAVPCHSTADASPARRKLTTWPSKQHTTDYQVLATPPERVGARDIFLHRVNAAVRPAVGVNVASGVVIQGPNPSAAGGAGAMSPRMAAAAASPRVIGPTTTARGQSTTHRDPVPPVDAVDDPSSWPQPSPFDWVHAHHHSAAAIGWLPSVTIAAVTAVPTITTAVPAAAGVTPQGSSSSSRSAQPYPLVLAVDAQARTAHLRVPLWVTNPALTTAVELVAFASAVYDPGSASAATFAALSASGGCSIVAAPRDLSVDHHTAGSGAAGARIIALQGQRASRRQAALQRRPAPLVVAPGVLESLVPNPPAETAAGMPAVGAPAPTRVSVEGHRALCVFDVEVPLEQASNAHDATTTRLVTRSGAAFTFSLVAQLPQMRLRCVYYATIDVGGLVVSMDAA